VYNTQNVQNVNSGSGIVTQSAGASVAFGAGNTQTVGNYNV